MQFAVSVLCPSTWQQRGDEEVIEGCKDVLEVKGANHAARRRTHDAGTHDELLAGSVFGIPRVGETALRILWTA